MVYVNGERTYKTDFKTKDNNGYFKIIDIDTKVELFLPEYVIRAMTYVFSWDRYHEDLDKENIKHTLQAELTRLGHLPQSDNIKTGMKHMVKFLEDLAC